MYEFRKGNLAALETPAALSAKKPPGEPEPAAEIADELPALKMGRCIDCLRARGLSGRLDGEITSVRCLEGIGGTWTVWGTGEPAMLPPLDAWHYCAGFVEAVAAKGVPA